MSAQVPFSMTTEAEDYVRAHLFEPPPGQELALITCLRESAMVEGKEEVVFDGEHFIFGSYYLGQRKNAQRIELFGHQVSIMPSTLESLRGRTLTVRNVERLESSKEVEIEVLVRG